jgi:hypothetical protein
MEIKFKTNKLFLTAKKNAVKNFNNYNELLDLYFNEGKKLSFN